MGKISVKGFQYDRLFIPGESLTKEYAGDICTGCSFIIRYPSYRGTFLSCIESFAVELDGKPVAEENVRFCIHGKEFVVSELKDLHREYWYVMEDAKIKITGENPAAGEHKVKVTMYHRIPYTGYFGNYLIWDNVGEKSLLTQEGAEK